MNSIFKIKENYKHLERSLVDQLFLETPTDHALTTGTYREQIWQKFFKKFLPKKFSIVQGVFIIDSAKKVSKEVDLAIFDEQFTPYIFNYGNIKFIPIEAVAMVVQCKSNNIDNANLEEWTNRMNLETSTLSIARMFQDVVVGDFAVGTTYTQTATRPIKVLCYLSKELKEGEKKPTKVKNGLFDITLCAKEENKELVIEFDENKTIGEWYEDLNHSNSKHVGFMKKYSNNETINKFAVNNNPILSLIFQLNQLLMLINNPMLFPHQAYADMFNRQLDDIETYD